MDVGRRSRKPYYKVRVSNMSGTCCLIAVVGRIKNVNVLATDEPN